MAEFVHQSLEETLAELEQLERVGLFSKAEIKAIVKKRTTHEYRLVRLKKKTEDFQRYIQYEVNVLALIKKRRERNNYFHKKEEIENVIISRIHRLFRRACTQFPDDLKVWMSHIQFCKKWGRLMEMNRLFTRLLKIHSDKPALWIMAAKFQLEDNKSADNARAIFLRSLRHHPKVQKLWIEYFRMELLHADKLRKRLALLKQTMIEAEESETEDSLMRGELAKLVYDNAIKAIPDDVSFRLAFPPVCRHFDFSEHLEDIIYLDLERDHPDKSDTWRALARRHLVEIGSEEEIWLSETRCHSVYDEAVEKVASVDVWSHYTETCVERLQLDSSSGLSNKRAEKAIAVYEAAEEQGQLSEHMFEQWVGMLRKLGLVEKALEVSERSTTTHSGSVSLWMQRLLLVMQVTQSDNPEDYRSKVRELFDSAVTHVKSKDSGELWNLGLEWCLTNDPETLGNLFECVLKEDKTVSLPLKTRYLEWIAINKGMSKARKLFKRLSTEKPISKEFFAKYIELEESQPSPKHKKISDAYAHAVREFGSTSPDLWLDYIRHERRHQEADPGKAVRIHWRAVKTLEGTCLSAFMNGYTLMQAYTVEDRGMLRYELDRRLWVKKKRAKKLSKS